MSDELLRAAKTIVLVDWPSRDVPETLARAGIMTIVKSGPAAHDYAVQELRDGAVTARRLERAPEQADLVYAYRPLAELRAIVELAQRLGARAVWWQSRLAPDEARAARELAAAAGLRFVDDVEILDAARRLG